MRQLLILFLFSATTFVFGQGVDSVKYALGQIDYSAHPEFVKISEAEASRSGMYLRVEALTAFKQMKAAAKKDGVDLRVISAARNFNHQKQIWEAKWKGQRLVNGQNLASTIPNPSDRAKEILKYSSMPGTSRHHWGTDIDINSLSPEYFNSGKGKKVYEWLREHAGEFGFCQVYSEKGGDRSHGYEEEKWHWSYIPIASKFTRFYAKNIGKMDLNGFEGADALPFSEIMKYVQGISKSCK